MFISFYRGICRGVMGIRGGEGICRFVGEVDTGRMELGGGRAGFFLGGVYFEVGIG